MKRFDLELLLVFDEIFKTGNVTRAADNLGLPQSSVSLALAKLRGHFNDQLFSRTAKGMVPTPARRTRSPTCAARSWPCSTRWPTSRCSTPPPARAASRSA